MKKILLGTSALFAFGMLASEASAQVALQISGEATFQGGFVSDDFERERDYDFRSTADLNFIATGEADNGLVYSGVIKFSDIDAGGLLSVNEVYVTMGGGWGTLTFGDDDGGTDLFVTPPTAGTGIADGDYGAFAAGGEALVFWSPDDTGDSTKIKYVSPVFNGFSIGASYTPVPESSGLDVNYGPGTFEDGFEVGARWAGTFNDLSLSVGAAGTFAAAVPDDGDDLESFGVGANVGWRAFNVGASFIVPDAEDTFGINGGATYTLGAWNFGLGASFVDYDGDDPDLTFGAGADYTIAPGLTLASDVVFYDRTSNGENAGTVFLVSTSVSF